MFDALILDEPLLTKVLPNELDGFDDIALIGEVADDESALEDTLDLAPDLAFLDVQVLLLCGLEVIMG